MNHRWKLFLVTLLACALAGPVDARKYPDESDDGLMRVSHKSLDAVYWREGATLAGYDRVMIGDVDVSFRKNWQRDQNRSRRSIHRVSAEDMARIRAAVAEGFTVIFIVELEEAGYRVVDQPGDDVLLLEPSIVDLDVHAPDVSMRKPGITRTYTTSTGEMTLNLELIDSGSNSLIGRVIDERRSRDTGQLRYGSVVTNRQEANIMYRAWAKALIAALDEAKNLPD